MSVAKKASQGFFHFLGRNMLARFMGLIAMVILARELSPYDFGLVSISQILLAVITVFATSGIHEYLLAYRGADKKEIFQAAFWFNLTLAAIVAIIAFILLPYWASSYDDSRIYYIGVLVIVSYVFSQVQTIPKAFLSKNLDFNKQIKVQSVFIILVPLTKIAAVFMDWGVYSLVIPTAIFIPFETFFLFHVAGFKPKLTPLFSRWLEIFNFTKNLIGSAIMGMLTTQGDKLILANFMSIEALGVYNMAWQLANFFTSNVVAVTNNILNATLPKLASDSTLLRKRYFQFLKMVVISIGPIIVTFALSAKEVLLLVYGSKWAEVVLPLQILCIYAFFRALTSSYGSIMNTMHLPHKSLIINTVYTPVHLLGSIVGVQFGVIGLAISVTLVKLIFIQWQIQQSMNAIQVRFSFFYLQLGRFLIITLIITIICLGAYFLYQSVPMNPILRIIGLTTIFCLLFLVFNRRWNQRGIIDVSEFIGKVSENSQLWFDKVFVK